MAQRLNKKLVAGLTAAGMLITTAAAIVMVMNLPQRDPGPAAEEAAKYAAQGDYKNAQQWYERAYRRSFSGGNPTADSNKYLVLVGDMALARGEATNAIRAWRQVVLNDPQHEQAQQKVVEFILELARDLRVVPWSEVQADSERLLNINPKNFAGLHALGLALINQRNVKEENLKKGAEYLLEAFNGDKSKPGYAEALAAYYMQERQDAKAVQAFEDLMANLPADTAKQSEAWRARGRFYLMRRLADQQEFAEKQRQRTSPSEITQFEQRITQSDTESLRSLDEALKLDPQNVDNLIALAEHWIFKPTTAKDQAQAAAKHKEYLTKAEQYLTQAIQIDKDGYQAYIRLASLYTNNQEFDKALQVLAQRQQRGVQREGYLSTRNKYYMSRVRNDMFRILMIQADQLRQQAGAQKSDLDKIVAQLENLQKEQAADAGQDDAAAMFMAGRIKILQGDRLGAIRDMEAAKRQVGDNPELHQYLAQLYLQIGETGAAQESLRSVLQAYPNNAAAWALQANLLQQLGQYEAALQAADTALQIDPQNRGALVAMARVYEAQKNWDKVKEISRQLAEGQASPVTSKLQQATIFIAQAQSEDSPNTELLAEADKLLHEVLADDPGNLAAIRQLVLLVQDPNRPGELEPKRAEEMQKLLKDQQAAVERKLNEAKTATQPAQQIVDGYQQVLEAIQWFNILVDPKASAEERAARFEENIKRGDDPFVVAVQLYQLYASLPDRFKEALEQLKKAYSLRSDQPGIVEALFVRALQDQDWAGAETYLQQAVKLGMDPSGGHFYRGRLLATRTDIENGFDKAIQEFRAGLKAFPSYSQGYIMLGRALVQVKQYEEAAQAFRQAYRLNPTSGTAALGLASIAALRGDETEKNMYLQVCERLIPDHPWVRAELQAMEDKRDPKKGIARREEMRKADPKDIQNLLSLAALYLNDGQADKAKAIYAEAHKLVPQDFRVIQAYTDFLRTKQPPENEAAVKLLQELVNSIDQKDPLQKATAQLLMATHLDAVRQQGGANVPTTQAVDEAFAAAAQISDKAAVRLDIGSYHLSNQRYTEAEKWFREGLAQTQAQKDADTEKNARIRIIEALIQSRSPAREEDLKNEIDAFRNKYVDDPYSFLAEGQYHLNAGRLDEALGAINNFVERRPDNALGHILRGDIYFMRSLWQPALDDYRTTKGLGPKGFNYRHRIRLALCLENLNQNDVAVAELNSILADEPQFLPALDELQRFYVKLSQWQEAEDMLNARRKADPENPEWDLRLMSLYRSSRDADKAIKAALNAVQKAKFAQNAVETLLQTYLYFERYDDLIRFTNEQLPADKRQGTVMDLLTAAAYAGKGDRVNALQRYNLVLDMVAGNMEGYINVAGDLKKRLGAQTTMEVFQQRLATKPDERPAKFVLGALQKDAGERDAYLNMLKNLLETMPKGDEPQIRVDKLYLLQCLAIEYYQRGNNEDARKTYEEMLTIEPNHLLAINNLAYLLMDRLNDPQSALAYARRAANMIPFDSNILDTVGWNHVLLGNYELGIAALRRAIGLDDKAAAIHYHAAEAFFRQASANPNASGREADLREAETECRRAYDLIREAGADREEVFDKVLALGEKLGLRLDPKLGPK